MEIKNIVKEFFKDRRVWLIIIALFILIISVFDKNNLIEVWKLKQVIKEQQVQLEYYQEKITSDSLILENLKSDTFLEQFARENYLMRRTGETIYIHK